MTRRDAVSRGEPVGEVATTAWGAAWLEVLVLGSTFEGTELARGRGLSARGAVVDLVLEPASVSATVVGQRSLERRVRLGFRRLPPESWTTVRSVVAASSRVAAAVLDGRLPTSLHERLVDAGCGLLPGLRDVSIDCSCGNLAESCVHAAAVCCRLAEVLDHDPLALVTLRGGDRAELLAGFGPALARRSRPEPGAGRSSALPGRPPDPTVAAATSWRRRPGEVPVVESRVAVGRPRTGATPPPAELGFDQAGLDLLVRDASARAAALLADGPAVDAAALDVGADAVRRAAAGVLDAREVAPLVGCSPDQVEGLIDAWRVAGPAGVDAVLRPRRLDAGELALVEAALDQPVKARSTGAVLADGGQVRRSDGGPWLLLRHDDRFGWRVVDVADRVDELAI